MKAAGLDKDEILVSLAELNDELVELELVLQTSLDELRSDWAAGQEYKLGQCSKRLDALENSMDTADSGSGETMFDFPGKKIVKLELGY